jgi:SAM-dependent methyltransferase
VKERLPQLNLHPTDAEWEKWGETDPYFGVLTHPRFRSGSMTEQDKVEFFESGVRHVESIMSAVERSFGGNISIGTVLDFGCGVGRLVMPFAEHATSVLGLDVSLSMLAEARRNCSDKGLTNVELLESNDSLDTIQNRYFDLVHSFIVLQHIDPRRGLRIIESLLASVAPGGVAAIHLTFARSYIEGEYGQPAPPLPPPPSIRRLYATALQLTLRKLLRATKQSTPLYIQEQATSNASAHGLGVDPKMLMYSYDLSKVIFIFHRAGLRHAVLDMTDHGGEVGAMILARRPL